MHSDCPPCSALQFALGLQPLLAGNSMVEAELNVPAGWVVSCCRGVTFKQMCTTPALPYLAAPLVRTAPAEPAPSSQAGAGQLQWPSA